MVRITAANTMGGSVAECQIFEGDVAFADDGDDMSI
jgi:hypothetical protein